MDDHHLNFDNLAQPDLYTSGYNPAFLSCMSEQSFRQYLQTFDAPQFYGFTQRVVDELTKRIGCSPLDIDTLACAVNQSKRTFQRKLRLYGHSYSDLRDMVRRQYAIHAVLNRQQRLEDVCNDLDFSDRSGLTIAFKRWTGLTPRAFRKVARECGCY